MICLLKWSECLASETCHLLAQAFLHRKQAMKAVHSKGISVVECTLCWVCSRQGHSYLHSNLQKRYQRTADMQVAWARTFTTCMDSIKEQMHEWMKHAIKMPWGTGETIPKGSKTSWHHFFFFLSYSARSYKCILRLVTWTMKCSNEIITHHWYIQNKLFTQSKMKM